MKIAVFGATGKTGRQVVGQALEPGYEVKGFVRDPQKMDIRDEKLSLVQGDVVDPESVEKCVLGADAVVVALGPKPENILAQGTGNIINAMKKHNVRRLIVESSYPMNGSPESIDFLKKSGMTAEQIGGVRPMLDDKIAQEAAVRESGLDWIIVRPLMLTDGAKTGNYRALDVANAEHSRSIKPGDNISRADVADFMLKQVKNDEWLGKTVVLSY